MTTEALYRTEPYAQDCLSTVIGHTPEGGILVDRTVFYPTGGGQPGDSGVIEWTGGRMQIATAVRVEKGLIALVPAEPIKMPDRGAELRQRLDWQRRHRHMRVHTALHLLSVIIPLPVTGGQIGSDRGRLDFDMPDPPGDLAALTDRLNKLVDADLPVTESFITDDELLANPGLVKTMSVRPPMGQGRVRLVRIGDEKRQIDLQPCGGTHVARTGEIGRLAIEKVEKKGKMNRRIVIRLEE